MSVLIEGMKMPKENPRTINIYRDGTWVDAYTTEDGKATELPPHGRLIDADAVYKRLQKQAMSVWGDGNPRYQIVLDVIDAIRFAPTVIEAEESEP